MHRLGLSYRWLAEMVGTSHPTVTAALSGSTKKPRDPKLFDKIQAVLEQYAKENRGVKDPVMLYGRTLREIPVLSTITAGEPWAQFADAEIEGIPDWGPEFNRWGRVVEGESMMPVLAAGDVAVFEDRRFKVNDVVHAYCDGVDTVKCIRGHDDEVALWPFNPDFKPIPAAHWKAKGVCVGRIRYGRFRVRQVVEFRDGLTWAMRHETF